MTKCQIPYCREDAVIRVVGTEMCWKHWEEHCKEGKKEEVKE